jgi:hypothetical protein
MATYTLISSNVLASSAASVTFSAIPATYTDLVVRLSARSDNASDRTTTKFWFNGNSGTTSFSQTILQGNGASATSSRNSSVAFGLSGFQDGATATASTFGNGEIYIPNYTTTSNRPTAGFSVQENNSSTAYINAIANLDQIAAAITSITIDANGSNWITGSSFYLYGISNA